MKETTKAIIWTAAITAAVAFVAEAIASRWYKKIEPMFVRMPDIESCLSEATVAEIRNELAKRQTEGSEIQEQE